MGKKNTQNAISRAEGQDLLSNVRMDIEYNGAQPKLPNGKVTRPLFPTELTYSITWERAMDLFLWRIMANFLIRY